MEKENLKDVNSIDKANLLENTEQKKLKRNKFENDLLGENVTDKYLNMSKEELETIFGSNFLKAVEYGNQNNIHHQYELFEHILRTVDSVQTDGLSQDDLLMVKIAAFFHDIGKPEVAKINEKNGQTQYIGHAKKSSEIAMVILEELGYSEQKIAEFNFLIKNHDEFIQITSQKDVTEARISKILESIIKRTKGYSPTISDFKKLFVLCKADAMAQSTIIEKDGKVIDTQEDKVARLDAMVQILPQSIVFQRENEIKKLEKQKSDLINGPTPIEKNGKIVNQKQIDLWNEKTAEQKKSEINSIDEKILILRREEEKLLEKDAKLEEKSRCVQSCGLVNESDFAQMYGKYKGGIPKVVLEITKVAKENDNPDISNR